MLLLRYTIVVVSVAATTVQADMCIKQRSHTDSYYYGGRVTPAQDSESELWIGSERLAYVRPGRQVIVNGKKNTLTFVNRQDSTYVTAQMPFDWSKLTGEDMLGTLARYRTHGSVEASSAGKTIRGWNCRGYEMTTWIDTDHGKYAERDSRVWVTRDLSIDWDVYRVLNLPILKLLNYDDDLVTVLDSIPGIVVRTEAQRYIHGFSVDSIEEVIEVQEIEPSADVYDVPAGFKKKESLTMSDLRG